MNFQLSAQDCEFKNRFEACMTPPSEFDHRSHIRLAYVYLCESGPEEAYARIKRSLKTFLAYHDVPPSKYHETMTKAWLLAIHHFMVESNGACSAWEFIESNPVLLKPDIMLTHYSRELLFSEKARSNYIEADLDPIPSEDLHNSL